MKNRPAAFIATGRFFFVCNWERFAEHRTCGCVIGYIHIVESEITYFRRGKDLIPVH